MTSCRDYIFVLPTLKTAGGNLEIVRLAEQLHCKGKSVAIIGMWHTPNPIQLNGIPVVILFDRPVGWIRALISIPLILLAFRKHVRVMCGQGAKVVLTHYATYLTSLFVPSQKKWFFVQALEWYFVPSGPLRIALRKFILRSYRKGSVLAANRFLRRSLEAHNITVTQTADIWADSFFAAGAAVKRDIDVALMFRKGVPKRADWGRALLERIRAVRPDLRIAVISPDEEFASVAGSEGMFLLRPSREEIRRIYQRSRVFILFSEHEGFGLPPLEAMGSGCVPLCRDAGGVRAYMEAELEINILPLSAPPDAMAHRLYALLDDETEWSRLSAVSRRVFKEGLERAAGRLSGLERCGFIDKRVQACR